MNIVTVSGIRPDFIRMSHVFKELDKRHNHTLIHTGQHYDKLLSDVFFEDLAIRTPDHNLQIGGHNKPHYYQVGELSNKLLNLLSSIKKPDIILFLGDSNSVLASVPLYKEGFKIGHIEAGMRSGDRRMLEETNRIVCDHCSHMLFTYHADYAANLYRENINKNVFVVGNTIVEPCEEMIKSMKLRDTPSKRQHIVLDIHRPENFKHQHRMENILKYAARLSKYASKLSPHSPVEVLFLQFPRTVKAVEGFNLTLPDGVKWFPLQSYRQFLELQYNSVCVVSDSGTAQEETCLLGIPTIVPRDFTERPQSVNSLCSVMLNVNSAYNISWDYSFTYIKKINESIEVMDTAWLGEGDTSSTIVDLIETIAF